MEIKMQIWQSLVIALWIALVQGRLSLFTLNLRYSPLMTSFVVGLVLGEVQQSIIIGAALQAIYFGTLGPGGNSPSEPAVATAVAVPIAILGGLSAESAIAIALPVGILATYLYQGRHFFNTYIMKVVDQKAQEADYKGLERSIIIYPLLVSILLHVPIMFIALQYGAPFIADFMASQATEQVFHVLNVVGGGLAATGIAAAIYVIGKKNYMVFFVFAYFMSILLKNTEVNMVMYAIFAASIAIMFELGQNGNLFNMKSSNRKE